MKKIDLQRKWIVALLAIFGVSLISGGVFAAAQITVNGNNQVNLGAGAAAVTACSNSATLSTIQSYNATNQRYELTTITLTGVNGCDNKTLALAFKAGNTTYSTTWGVQAGTNRTLTWGGSGTLGGDNAYSTFPAINIAANDITTIAISAQ
jgi:hypothetical protein